MVLNEKEKSKININYTDGKIHIELSETARKVLNKFIVNNENSTEVYFASNYYRRHLIKVDLRRVLTDTEMVFFTKDIINPNVSFMAYCSSVHQYETQKKQLQKAFKTIMKFYLNYDFSRGENGV